MKTTDTRKVMELFSKLQASNMPARFDKKKAMELFVAEDFYTRIAGSRTLNSVKLVSAKSLKFYKYYVTAKPWVANSTLTVEVGNVIIPVRREYAPFINEVEMDTANRRNKYALVYNPVTNVTNVINYDYKSTEEVLSDINLAFGANTDMYTRKMATKLELVPLAYLHNGIHLEGHGDDVLTVTVNSKLDCTIAQFNPDITEVRKEVRVIIPAKVVLLYLNGDLRLNVWELIKIFYGEL